MKIDPENGMFIGPDNCHYETEWEARSSAVLGMCGCGNPEAAYNFLREVLKCFDRRGCHADPPVKDWVDSEDEIEKLILANPAIAAHCLSHFLTDKRVLEHGGSVGGSWLTKSGEEIVDNDAAPENAE